MFIAMAEGTAGSGEGTKLTKNLQGASHHVTANVSFLGMKIKPILGMVY